MTRSLETSLYRINLVVCANGCLAFTVAGSHSDGDVRGLYGHNRNLRLAAPLPSAGDRCLACIDLRYDAGLSELVFAISDVLAALAERVGRARARSSRVVVGDASLVDELVARILSLATMPAVNSSARGNRRQADWAAPVPQQRSGR